jgi:hypothetical protein
MEPVEHAYVARCTTSTSVHNHDFLGDLLQTAGGRLLRRRRSVAHSGEWEAVESRVDLIKELAKLKSAGPVERVLQRGERMTVEAGTATVSLLYPRPMLGEVPTGHPADRIYNALWGWPEVEAVLSCWVCSQPYAVRTTRLADDKPIQLYVHRMLGRLGEPRREECDGCGLPPTHHDSLEKWFDYWREHYGDAKPPQMLNGYFI